MLTAEKMLLRMDEPDALDSLWRQGPEPIEPMIEYYAREMGQLAGRRMAALSLMVDLEDSYGWGEQSAQVRETVH